MTGFLIKVFLLLFFLCCMVRLTFNVFVSRRRFEDRKKIFRRKRVDLKNLIRHILTKKKEKKFPQVKLRIVFSIKVVVDKKAQNVFLRLQSRLGPRFLVGYWQSRLNLHRASLNFLFYRTWHSSANFRLCSSLANKYPISCKKKARGLFTNLRPS